MWILFIVVFHIIYCLYIIGVWWCLLLIIVINIYDILTRSLQPKLHSENKIDDTCVYDGEMSFLFGWTVKLVKEKSS